jgi:hypothetical protein
MHAADCVTLKRELRELCQREGDTHTLGHLAGQAGLRAEKDGDIGQAVALWREAVEAGSTDPHVADRLSTWLVKNQQLSEAVDVLRIALTNQDMPVQLGQRLEKRLARAQRGQPISR